MDNHPSVMLVVVNHNEKDWLKDCLPSIFATDYPNFKTVVIDNASDDASALFIKDNFSGVELIINKRNIGFGGAVNMAMNIAKDRALRYLVILNPDIKVTPTWLVELVGVMESDENIGISMPLHLNYSGDEIDSNLLKILDKNSQYLKDKAAGDIKEKYEVASAIGGCMAIRTDVIKKVGFMDILYFSYGEDSDFCRRAVFHGYKIVVAMKSRIMHWHRILHKDKIDRRTAFFLFRNQFVYFLKDPAKPFSHNLWRYFFDRQFGALGMIKSWAPISIGNWRYLVLAAYVQFWILLHLPSIFARQMRQRSKL